MIKIFDGHNDLLLRMATGEGGPEWSFFTRNDTGHIDLPRAREGGLAGGFFAILAPAESGDALARSSISRTADGYSIPMAPALGTAYAQEFAMKAIAILYGLERDSNGEFAVVRTTDELHESLATERLAAVLHFEGAEPIDEDLHALEVFYQAGLRSLGLVWSRPNIFGHGVPFRFPHSPDTGPGLTPAGKRLVRACNGLGVMIDMAHLNEQGFWDVAATSEHPLVVTHACAHAICPSARNLTDRQIDAIGESGGVIGTNFFIGDLHEDGAFDLETPLSQIVRHIDYIAQRIGVEHVAFGSDFDGARIPTALGDAAGLPRLVEALVEHGFSSEEVTLITSANWLRVLGETWVE